jgi:hypothetical protein
MINAADIASDQPAGLTLAVSAPEISAVLPLGDTGAFGMQGGACFTLTKRGHLMCAALFFFAADRFILTASPRGAPSQDEAQRGKNQKMRRMA